MREFFKFMYELRKFDAKNELSPQILKKRVNPPMLLDIILSNQYNPAQAAMNSDAVYKIYT